MPRKDHLPRQTRQEHITLQPNRSIEFRVTDDFGSFSPPHWHDALEIIYILEGSSIVTLSDRTKTVLPGQFLLINSGRIHTARCPSTGNRSILMQIPDAFLANYLPDPSQLWSRFSVVTFLACSRLTTTVRIRKCRKISASSGVFCFR